MQNANIYLKWDTLKLTWFGNFEHGRKLRCTYNGESPRLCVKHRLRLWKEHYEQILILAVAIYLHSEWKCF